MLIKYQIHGFQARKARGHSLLGQPASIGEALGKLHHCMTVSTHRATAAGRKQRKGQFGSSTH